MTAKPTTTTDFGVLTDTDLSALAITTTQPIKVGNTNVPGGQIFSGSGVPSALIGVNGDFYFRTDTPGTLAQRIYIKSGGSWVNALA